jgi:superfamily II DNA helicase RecQ
LKKALRLKYIIDKSKVEEVLEDPLSSKKIDKNIKNYISTSNKDDKNLKNSSSNACIYMISKEFKSMSKQRAIEFELEKFKNISIAEDQKNSNDDDINNNAIITESNKKERKMNASIEVKENASSSQNKKNEVTTRQKSIKIARLTLDQNNKTNSKTTTFKNFDTETSKILCFSLNSSSLLYRFQNCEEASLYLDIPQQCIENVVIGKRKSTNKLKFSYDDDPFSIPTSLRTDLTNEEKCIKIEFLKNITLTTNIKNGNENKNRSGYLSPSKVVKKKEGQIIIYI